MGGVAVGTRVEGRTRWLCGGQGVVVRLEGTGTVTLTAGGCWRWWMDLFKRGANSDCVGFGGSG